MVSSSKLLSQLTLAKKPEKLAFNPQLHRRNKLLTRLQEQREMARCMLEGETFAVYVYKDKWVTDEVTGEKTKVSLPKRVKAWYYEIEGNMYFEVRSGNKAPELAKGKAAIAVSEPGKLLEVIDTVIEAANAGELDGLLMAVKRPGSK
jgi:hypothetical protein